MKSGGLVLDPSALSPTVNTVPGIESRIAAVASSLVRSQRAMSPAPTSTCPTAVPVDASTPGPAGPRGPMGRSPEQVVSSTVATTAAGTAIMARGLRTTGRASTGRREGAPRLHLRRRADTVAPLTPQEGARLGHFRRIGKR